MPGFVQAHNIRGTVRTLAASLLGGRVQLRVESEGKYQVYIIGRATYTPRRHQTKSPSGREFVCVWGGGGAWYEGETNSGRSRWCDVPIMSKWGGGVCFRHGARKAAPWPRGPKRICLYREWMVQRRSDVPARDDQPQQRPKGRSFRRHGEMAKICCRGGVCITHRRNHQQLHGGCLSSSTDHIFKTPTDKGHFFRVIGNFLELLYMFCSYK